MAPEYPLTIEENPEAADITFIADRLREYNSAQVGPSGYRKLAIFLRDEAGAVVAGLVGGSFWGWLHVDLFWVQEELRGQDQGSRLIQAAEQEALARGWRGVYLDTFSFQAPGFYRKRGYTTFGELEGIPPGHSHFFLRKVLVGDGEGNAPGSG